MVTLRQEDAPEMAGLSQRMRQSCHAKAGGCSRHAGAEAGDAPGTVGLRQEDDAVPQNPCRLPQCPP